MSTYRIGIDAGGTKVAYGLLLFPMPALMRLWRKIWSSLFTAAAARCCICM